MKYLLTLLAGTISAALIFTHAHAGDLPTKAPPQAGYPSTHCGFYYGIGVGGNAGAVTTNVSGTQIVQGDLSANVGYTCPFATYGFWFAEIQGGISNLNGGTILANTGTGIGGINLNGPAVFIERFGAGSPLNALLGGLLPSGNNFLNALQAAIPSVPILPAGVTLSPANMYAFVGLVEADYGATLGVLSGHQFMVSPLLGIGNLQRASNNLAVDTWAGFQFGSTSSLCLGGLPGACNRLGNMIRVGTSLKW
jgi:hypothetical protein